MRGSGAVSDFQRNAWNRAMPSRALKRGKMVHQVFVGDPVVIARAKDGQVFALRDLCPHRGVLLSAGRLCAEGSVIDGTTLDAPQIECPYHGWRFGPDGTCKAIPCLVEGQEMDIGKIRVLRYPVRDIDGQIWIWLPEAGDGPVLADTPEPDHEPPVSA
jgi:phenylpropionate dioxygenase-like ring-hydroxylating dioxygenase large terminal subunit